MITLDKQAVLRARIVWPCRAIRAAAIGYAAFCRITRLDAYAMTRARLAYVLLGIASLASVFSVLFWGYEPGVLDVRTSFALDVIKDTTALPLPGGR